MKSVPMLEFRKHPRFPAQGREILGPSHIVAFVEELHAIRSTEYGVCCIGMPISRRAHTNPNPTNQLGVNCAAKRLSTFASQRLCLIALIVEWSVGVSKRYTVRDTYLERNKLGDVPKRKCGAEAVTSVLRAPYSVS